MAIFGLLKEILGLSRVALTFPWSGKRAQIQCCVFVSDLDGVPIEVVLVGPFAEGIPTDRRGIGRIPPSWLGRVISVRDPRTWTEMAEYRLPNKSGETIRIVVRT